MSPEVVECYIKAGQIIANVRERVGGLVEEGTPLLSLCEKVETLIDQGECRPAFPCNVDINEIAAHYTSPPDDPKVIPSGAVVKVDLGAHLDGYVADTAVTVSFDPLYEVMVQAVEEALEKAVKLVRPGAKFNDVGSTIERKIKAYGFHPVRNLSGHLTTRFIVHGPVSIPNVASPFEIGKFASDNIYAIEPFATTADAAGEVVSLKEAYIYHLIKLKPPKAVGIEKLLRTIKERYWTLPFAKRWLLDVLPSEKLDRAFATLLSHKIIQPYPVLIEKTARPVVQAEHTILLTKNDAIVITW